MGPCPASKGEARLQGPPACIVSHEHEKARASYSLTIIIVQSGPANTLLRSTTLMPVSGFVADVLWYRS